MNGLLHTARLPLQDGDLLAAVDLGSNSFHMVVSRYLLGQLRTVDRIRETVRLAEGLDRKGGLSPEARDRALEHHKLAIKGAEIRSKAVEANLAEVNARIAAIEKAGRKVGTGLIDQADQAARESLELKRTILNNGEAMQQVREKYAADKVRFRELTAK